MPVLNQPLQRLRLRSEGVTISKEKRIKRLLDFFESGPKTTPQVANHIGITRERTFKDYIKPLVEQGKLKKVENSRYYALVEDKTTRQEIRDELYEESEIMETQLYKNWIAENSAKDEHSRRTQFANICLGNYSKDFKIHPDNITKENWESIVRTLVPLLKKYYGIPVNSKEEIPYSTRQAIRHAIIYGRGVTISEEKGRSLGISGEKPKEKSSDLHITPEQITEAKKILKDDKLNLIKFGVKTWTFVRPSTIYIIETDKVKFYDREVQYVEVNGERKYKEELIEFAKTLLLLKPELKDIIKLGSFKHRACYMEVFENKTQTDYNKYIYDEDFVKPLEAYWKQRKFEKKKYLFWDDNNTNFTFENYNKIVEYKVNKDNNYFKQVLTKLGFQKSDFGDYFRANYGFRHFGIQMWLVATDYDYDLVSTMSHDDTATLKKWYGKPQQAHVEKMLKGVVV